MRLLLVDRSGGPGGGGSALYTESLARRLAVSHDVTLLCATTEPERPHGHLGETQCDGLRVVSLNRFPSAGFESYRDPRVTAALRPLLDRLQPELVHVGSLDGLSTGFVFAARERGAPVVLTLHDFWPVCPLGQLLNRDLAVCPGPTPRRCLECVGDQVLTASRRVRALGRRLACLRPLARGLGRVSGIGADRTAERLTEMRAVLRAADRVLAPSRFLRDRLAGLGITGVEHVPLGVPSQRSLPHAPDPRGRVRFGFLGSLIPSKGLHVLVEAYRSLDDARAVLRVHGGFSPYHGDAGYEARVRQALGASADEVLRGAFAHRQLAGVLSGLDTVVVPSLWEENAPLVVYEALRARRPILASDHGGLAELVREGVDGLRVPAGDAAALARAMRRLIGDPGLRARLGSDPPHVPDMDEHVGVIEGVYAEAKRTYRTRPGRIGVVVADRGRPEEAAAAARSSLDRGLDVHVVIVEDGGGEGPPPESAREGPPPKSAREGPWQVLRLPENRGFAAAANAGIGRLSAAGCNRILVLNNDARLEPGSLRLLAEALGDERLGAVGPVVIQEADGRVESQGMRFELRWGRVRLSGQGGALVERAGVVPVSGLSGVALMISRQALARVGPFDEGYFHGFEDADWCVRLARAGLEQAVVLGARAWHRGALTLGEASPARLYYAARNHLRAAERLAPRGGLGRWLRRASIAALNLAHAATQTSVPRGRAIAAVVSGTRAAWRGRCGKWGGR
jgi:GT2 family glycosyltransferase/glycosyltransferase involved in cell wall biosynthesis